MCICIIKRYPAKAVSSLMQKDSTMVMISTRKAGWQAVHMHGLEDLGVKPDLAMMILLHSDCTCSPRLQRVTLLHFLVHYDPFILV